MPQCALCVDSYSGLHVFFALHFALAPFDQTVHAPLEAMDIYKNSPQCAAIPNADRQTFCGMAAAADDAIGNLTAVLIKEFEGDDMIMVVGGDNGGMPQSAGNNFPLRGHKAELWEGGIRNNAIAWSPTLIPDAVKGSTFKGGLVHVMDWHGTSVAAVLAAEWFAEWLLSGAFNSHVCGRGESSRVSESRTCIDPSRPLI